MYELLASVWVLWYWTWLKRLQNGCISSKFFCCPMKCGKWSMFCWRPPGTFYLLTSGGSVDSLISLILWSNGVISVRNCQHSWVQCGLLAFYSVSLQKYIVICYVVSLTAPCERLCTLLLYCREALDELGFGLKVINSAQDLNEAQVVIFAESGHIESVVQVLSLWCVVSVRFLHAYHSHSYLRLVEPPRARSMASSFWLHQQWSSILGCFDRNACFIRKQWRSPRTGIARDSSWLGGQTGIVGCFRAPLRLEWH